MQVGSKCEMFRRSECLVVVRRGGKEPGGHGRMITFPWSLTRESFTRAPRLARVATDLIM